MQTPLRRMRIPYTSPLPPPLIHPRSANTAPGAAAAVATFLASAPSPHLQPTPGTYKTISPQKTVLLTGAGISVASGLADYRGTAGTYTLNKTYRPIYYAEFTANHEARKRYWARSFLGWTTLHRSRPNATHAAIADLAELGFVSSVITQNVDSFHRAAHPHLSTLELHGYLRATVCLTCRTEYPRDQFQERLAALNPAWASFLEDALESDALETENPDERRAKGLRTNPDGDVDLPDAPYSTFRYPPCPHCLADPALKVEADADGAWAPYSEGGVLKPAVVMFGESIKPEVKSAAEHAVDEAGRILVLGSSLATYSAWRLVKRARDRGMPIGVLNLGGVRGEESFLEDVIGTGSRGETGVRASESTEKVLPMVVQRLRSEGKGSHS
ncbi:hypothetical protein FH972_023766 [Carpinus fangiana]|uniref:Deacetylase sirtuin-type domain-containing protein n=1 Tax=Carpinus fangiana TaxID=176857 RepID=A0A5N6KWI5_9ROSI|nr:hypothetical protein FH972_023766 [Carpinus fangiana]